MLQRVDELTEPPIIGQYYLVRCLALDGPAGRHFHGKFIPIIGDKHEDGHILNFPHHHYHIDWRFVSARNYQLGEDSSYEGARFAKVIVLEGFEGTSSCRYHSLSDTKKLRPLKCKREIGDFPTHQKSFHRFHEGPVRFMAELEATYKGCKLKSDHLCPHKRFNLSSIKENENGLIVCPGHGLAFNKETKIQTNRL